MKLENRTILITGGTSGIGLELARRLHERGNTVIVTGRDRVKLEDTERALPGVHTFKSDISDPDAIKALYDSIVAEFPALDTLVNNAGIMRNLDLSQERDLTDVTREIEIDLSGPVRMVQQFLPHLKTRERALIVNVSSGLAFIPLSMSPVYSAAKAGIHAYSQALREQLEGTNATVVEVAPPPVETPLLRGLRGEFEEGTREQSGMAVEVLAQRAIAGIEAGRLEIRPGLSNVLKAMSRIAPHFMFNQLTRMSRPQKPKGATG